MTRFDQNAAIRFNNIPTNETDVNIIARNFGGAMRKALEVSLSAYTGVAPITEPISVPPLALDWRGKWTNHSMFALCLAQCEEYERTQGTRRLSYALHLEEGVYEEVCNIAEELGMAIALDVVYCRDEHDVVRKAIALVRCGWDEAQVKTYSLRELDLAVRGFAMDGYPRERINNLSMFSPARFQE